MNASLLHGRHNSRCARALSLLMVWCALALAATTTLAQEKQVKVDESLADRKGAILASGNEAEVKDFLQKYYLARWTVRANSRDIIKYRQELETDAVSLSGQAQQTFLKLVVATLRSYAGSKDVYPACRYNAVLAIGSLNEANGADRNSLPTPYAGAISTLANIVKSTNEVPDYVRLGALIGLVRHAEVGIKDEKNLSGVKSIFASVLDSKYKTEKGLRDDVYEWFQMKALQGLASFKSPSGSKGGTGTLDLFKSIIDDEDQNFELRCEAARAIGEMNLNDLKSDYLLALGKSLVTLARDFCLDEMSYIDSELVRDSIKSSANSMGGGMGGSMGGGMGSLGGGMDSMGGGLGGGMGGGLGGGSIQNQKSMEVIIARIQYGFDCIQRAVKGPSKNAGTGLLVALNALNEKSKDAKVTDMIETLDKLVKEFDATNTFISEGPKNSSGMLGGGSLGMGAGMGMGGGSEIKVDAASMKDHMLERKIKINELLGIDSY